MLRVDPDGDTLAVPVQRLAEPAHPLVVLMLAFSSISLVPEYPNCVSETPCTLALPYTHFNNTLYIALLVYDTGV